MNPTATVPAWAAVGAVVGVALALVTRRVMNKPCVPLLLVPGIAVPTATLFGLLAWRLPQWPELLAYSSFAAAAVPLAVIDVVELRLPHALVGTTYVAMIVFFGAATVVHRDPTDVVRAAAGMVTLLVFYLVVALVSREGLGAGDVKLGGLLGLALGWASWSAVLTGTVLGWFLGAIAWLALRVTGRASQDALLPMGPFLLLGTLVTIGTMPPA